MAVAKSPNFFSARAGALRLCLLIFFLAALTVIAPELAHAQRQTTNPDAQDQSQADQQQGTGEQDMYDEEGTLGPQDQGRIPQLVECRNGRTPDGRCKPPELPDAQRKTLTDTQQPYGRSTRRRDLTGRELTDEELAELARREREKLEPKSEFQNFAETSVGRELPLFGRTLFAKVPSTFAPADQIPVTVDYPVGPGDQLLIRAWGQVNIDYSVTVDRNGSIYIPDVGTVNVAGIKYGQLQEYLRSAISRVYRNFDLSVTLGQLRSIQVLVVGLARRPGNYTVSALSTIVNGLFASGGPAPTGSMRHIQLKRGSRLVTEFDLYDLLLNGDKSKDVQLQNGDVIFVPPVGGLIAVSGSVNVPAIYEVKDGTTLKDALRLAGDLSTTAEAKQVTVERIANRSVRQVDQIPLDPEGLSRPIKDGDIIRVLPLISKFDNAVTLRGNVSRIGRYPWHEGMRVRDLVPSREALIVPSFWESRNTVGLATRPRVGQKALRTEVKRDAPDINWDYAVIERLNLETLTTKLIPFNLGQAISSPDSPDNLLLQPNDVITVFSQADFPVPLAKRTIFVRLEGEFVKAGVYQVEPGTKLQQAIERAGGLTPNGYLFGVQFTRESVKESQQERLKELVDRLESDLQAAIVNQLQRPGTADSAQLLQVRIQNQRVAIQRLRQVEPTGRVALDLRPTDSLAAMPDFELEDGDVVTIPSRPSTVSVLGAVYSQGDLVYREAKTVDDYVRQAGGPTREADKGRIYVIRASGIVRSSSGHPGWAAGSFGNLRLMPGDAIVVPTNPDRVPLVTAFKDWSQIFAQFALGAGSLKVLLGL